MTTLRKPLVAIPLITTFLLLIPLVAMQFTNQVNWTLSDFVKAGVVLLGTGLLFNLAWRKAGNLTYRIAACIAVLMVFILVWLELAVGIFGTPFAGQ